MTAMELMSCIGQVKGELVLEARNMPAPGMKRPRRGVKRALLIAAVISLLLLLVGCGVVYVLQMKNLKVGQRETTRHVFDEYHREVIGEETVPQQVLTLSGLKGSPSYQAAKEWFDFQQSYDPDGTIRKEAFQGDPEAQFPDTYWTYRTYSREMVDKLQELAGKYGLKLLGAPMEFTSMSGFTRAVGIDHVLLPDSEVSAYLDGGDCYPGGNFNISMDLNMPEGEGMWPYTIHARLVYCRQDCLSTEFEYLDLEQDWKEWSYTTASGATVLILRAPEGEAYLFCDCSDAILTVHFEAGFNPLTDIPDFVPEWMTDRQVEQVADAIDFTIRPQLPDPDAAVVTGHTPGWEIETKNVCFDGSFGWLVFHLTAPAGTALPGGDGEYVYPDNTDHEILIPDTGELGSNFWTFYSEDDGDGLENTTDLVYIFGLETIDDPDFPMEANWIAHIEDLTASYMEGRRDVEKIIAEGVWEPEFSFTGCDTRRIECLREPLTVSSDQFKGTIESFQLRSLGAVITVAEGSGDCGFLDAVAVLKDGTEIPMSVGDCEGRTARRLADRPIDLDQVSAVRLPDGTELPVPQA